MALITAAQVREHYPTLTGTGEDSLLATLIERADALMAAYCGYPLPDSGGHTLEDTTYTVRASVGIDRRVAWLPVRPVVSITSIYDDPAWSWGSDTLVPSTDYTLDGRTGEVWIHGEAVAWSQWSEARGAVKVVCVAGYATTPPGLVALAAYAVRAMLDRGHAGDVLSAAGGRSSYSQEASAHLLPRAVRAGLDAGYRIWGTRVS